MSMFERYGPSVEFLRTIDGDWDALIVSVGPCRHDPKAAREPYEALIRAIAYQQLTAKAGDAIIGRLRGISLASHFPSPQEILAAEFETLRGCGFSKAKVATIRAIADASLSGLVPNRKAAIKMDDEELITRIASIKGIGRWTVEMLLMYSLERGDVLPVDDFGIREGYRLLKSLPQAPSPKELREVGRAWAPHRTVAAWYLWRVPRERGKSLK